MSYQTFEFGPWRLEVDVEATRAAYAEMEHGHAETCSYSDCRNFSVAREYAYPSEVRTSLEALGIDLAKEPELAPIGYREPTGLWVYPGFFLVFGRLASEDTSEGWDNGIFQCHVGTSVGRHSPFVGDELLHFGFTKRVPWLIDEQSRFAQPQVKQPGNRTV